MQGVFVFIIVVTMLIIIIIVTNRKSYYTEEVVSSPTEADFKSKYDVPSIWSSGTDVTGCNLYTFKSSKFSVSSPSLSSSTTCQSSGTCTTSFDQGCRDDDQIYSKTVSHVCRFGELLVASLEDYKGCILSGGTVVKINGYYEEYNTPCSSSLSATDSTDNRCPGTLALVSMPNTGDLNTSVCISTPLYQDVYSSTLPIIGDPCDMSQTYKGVPIIGSVEE